MLYLYKVRAIKVLWDNAQEVVDWASHSGFNGVVFYGWSTKGMEINGVRFIGMEVNSVRCVKYSWALPSNWIVEIRPLDYVVISNDDFCHDFLECI